VMLPASHATPQGTRRMIRFNCSECDRPFKVADEHAGKSIRCPGCKGVIKVPAEEEEEPAPPPRKRTPAVLSSDDAPPRRKARLQEPEENDDAPRRRRRDEDDEDDRPRKKKKKKKPEEVTDSTLFLAVVLGLGVLFVLLGGVGFFVKHGAIAMLVVGLIPIGIGTWWINDIARREGDFEYLACRFVPFYDTYFSLSRWGQTWAACIMCWIGRAFVFTAVILLIFHMLREGSGGGGGGFGLPDFPTTPAEVDAECVRLLKAADAAEARGWLAVPNRRVQNVTVGRVNVRPAVEGLYQQGAVRVTFADMALDEDGDDPMHLVVELPAEKERRQAVVNYVNTQLLEEGDPPQTDRGQKYLLVLTN
ncbi:MAG: hypothetical protein ACRC33_31890, partial [Gemmataceae bacterium]